jgi:hypothetical protein
MARQAHGLRYPVGRLRFLVTVVALDPGGFMFIRQQQDLRYFFNSFWVYFRFSIFFCGPAGKL